MARSAAAVSNCQMSGDTRPGRAYSLRNTDTPAPDLAVISKRRSSRPKAPLLHILRERLDRESRVLQHTASSAKAGPRTSRGNTTTSNPEVSTVSDGDSAMFTMIPGWMESIQNAE
jgi:hypothetical protein